jgi:hypothetical protein
MVGYFNGKIFKEKLEKKWGNICVFGNYFVSLH